MPPAIPASATGSYLFGMEGYIQPVAGGARYWTLNPVVYAAVTDPAPVARRKVVDLDNCNNCHESLALHGGFRNNTQYCVACHNANNTLRAPTLLEGESGVAETIDFKHFIHKLHSEAAFPGDLRDCQTCHEPGTYTLPLSGGPRLPSMLTLVTCTEDPAADGDTACATTSSQAVYTPPITSACTGCHEDASTAAHAEIMTTISGVESCETCHGTGKLFDVTLVHAREP